MPIDDIIQLGPTSPDQLIKDALKAGRQDQAAVMVRFAHLVPAWNKINEIIGVVNSLSEDGFQGTLAAGVTMPAGDKDWYWRISSAGQLGVDGPIVEIGDQVICTVDGTTSGDWSVSGTNFMIIEKNVINSFDNILAPTATDDEDSGYAVGSIWFNHGRQDMYVCTDATATAAVWVKVTLLNNMDAVVSPTVNDDSGNGYATGSLWYDVSAREVFVCTDPTPGAAIWVQIGNRNKFDAVLPPGITNDETEGYQPGSMWFATGRQILWIAESVATGAAVWKQVTVKRNHEAVIAPTVNDDVDLGYNYGSSWFDTVLNQFYICSDPTDGAAVWQLINETSMPALEQGALSGPGAFNLTEYCEAWTSAGTGDALTLADSSKVGQLKKIIYIAEAAGADTGILSLTGYTSITFNAIGDYVLLRWNGTDWIAIEYVGVTLV